MVEEEMKIQAIKNLPPTFFQKKKKGNKEMSI